MSILSELESKAVNEGISIGEESASTSPVETPKEAVIAASAPASPSKDTQVSSPAKTEQVSEDNVPFHKHPRFHQVTKENREFKEELARLKQELLVEKQVRERLNAPKGQEIPEEQRLAIVQLAKLFKQSPEFQKELGLDRIQELERQNQEYASKRSEEAFGKELDEVVAYGVSLGMDKEELSQELLEAIQTHPVYSQIQYSPGLVRAVFRDSKWDSLGELKEREANAKLIKEQEAKRKSNSETTSSSSEKSAKKLEPSMDQFLARRIKEEGGISL